MTKNKKKKISVDDAYALETPEDNARLYAAWAATYDTDFADAKGYRQHFRIAELLLRNLAQIDGAVLDVGCGTGLVGVCLREGGAEIVDGVDISEAMLAEAGSKTTTNGDSVYRNLIAADLTKGLDIPDNSYAALVSAGTFTHGHLGPDPLDELWRVGKAGAWCAISVRSTHFESAGFAAKIAADVAEGKITEPNLLEINVYSSATRDAAHGKDTAFVIECQIAK